MNRADVEIKLNRDRAWLLETLTSMSEDDLYAPRTFSEHDPDGRWSYADHFIHTTLIERNWNDMFRRHLQGDRGMEKRINADGTPQTMEQIMAGIHAWTEEWCQEHQGKPLDELIRIGLETRAETLAYLATLTQEQLDSKIPGAPWADGTVGGIMAANADHGRMHFNWAKKAPLPPLRKHLPAAVLGTVALAVFLVMQYRWFPHLSKNNDEGVYLFQSELFRSGHLTLPSADVGGGLRPWMSGIIGDRTVLVFPPGWPAVLALGTIVLPFKVVGALAATFAVLAIYALTHELLRSRLAAVIAGAFALASPLLLVLGGTVLSYPFALGLGATSLTAVARAVRTDRPRLLLLAGVASGALFATRPLDAVLVTTIAALHLLWAWRRRLGVLLRALPWAAAGAVPFVIAVLLTNAATTGSPTRFPVHANGGDNALGFGERQISEGARVFDVTPEFMERVTRRLLGELPHWTLAGLAVAPLVLWGAAVLWRRRRPAVPTMVLLGVAFPVAYFFYWGTHFVFVGRRDYGPFYYLPMLVPIAVGVGGGLAALACRSRIAAGVLALGLLATLPASIAPKYERAERHNEGVSQEVRLVAALPKPSLVILPGSNDGPWMLHVRGYFRNPPDLRSDRLFTADNGGHNLDVVDRFPEHTPHHLIGVLPPDVVLGDPEPRIERLRKVGGRSLVLRTSFVNESDNPTVMAYVGVPDGFTRCVLDEESVRGRTYTATWTLSPGGVVPPPGCVPLPPILANGQRLGTNLVVGYAASATTDIDGVNRWEYLYSLRTRANAVDVLDPGVPRRTSAGDLGEPRADYPGAVDHVLDVDVTAG